MVRVEITIEERKHDKGLIDLSVRSGRYLSLDHDVADSEVCMANRIVELTKAAISSDNRNVRVRDESTDEDLARAVEEGCAS